MRKSRVLALYFVAACIVVVSSHSIASDVVEHSLYDDYEPTVDPVLNIPANMKIKFVYISFLSPSPLDSIPPGNHRMDLRQSWVEAIPYDFSEFFLTESRGNINSIDCEVVVNSQQPGQQWIASHTVEEYRNGSISTYEDYRDAVWAEVHAEIVFKIYDTLVIQQGEPNPFADCDYVFFVPRYKMWTDGKAGFAAHRLINMPAHVFPSHIKGTTSLQVSGRQPFSDDSLRFVLAHEFGHKLGAGHVPGTPPQVEGQSIGAYALMRPVVLFGHGYTPLHFKSLHSIGWVDDPVIVPENGGTILLSDLQGPTVQGTHKAIKIPLERAGGVREDEAFYLFYHGGLGYASGYPSEGVAIWHYNDGTWDNETFRGCFEDPRAPVLVPDAMYGEDLRDQWWDDPEDRDHYFIYYETGDVDDFFPVTQNTMTEFNYASNPLTYSGATSSRLAPQTNRTSLSVFMTKTAAGHVQVDVYPAPREDILSPSGPITITHTSPLQVTWADFFATAFDPQDVIADQVELWFSSTGGASYDSVTAVPYSDHGLIWYDSYYTTNNGRFKLVFTNTYSDAVGLTEFDHNIAVDGSGAPWEAILSPKSGDNIVLGWETPIIWSDSWPSGTFSQIDLYFRPDPTTPYSLIESDIGYTSIAGENTYLWNPAGLAETLNANVMLRFHSATGTADREAEGGLAVLELNAVLDEVTSTALPEPFWGTPAGLAPIDADGDDDLDLMVSIAGEGEGVSTQLYEGNPSDSGEIVFLQRTNDWLPLVARRPGFGEMAVADFNADGNEDIFLCRPDDDASILLKNTGYGLQDNSSVAFADIDPELLTHVICGAWVDFDHDGDLDLHLGRGQPGGPGWLFLPDALLRHNSVSDRFTDVASDFGLDFPTTTYSVQWADINRNQFWDVLVTAGGATRWFEESFVRTGGLAETDTFVVRATNIPSELPISNLVTSQLADSDREGNLDLISIWRDTVHGEDRVYVTDQNAGRFDTSKHVDTAERRFSHAIPVDYDLDGWVDLFLPSQRSTDTPGLYANCLRLGNSDIPFRDISASAGLEHPGVAGLAVAADFNADGDFDFFVGRENGAQGSVYRTMNATGSETLVSNWVTVELQGVDNLAPPYGAEVVIMAGSSSEAKLLDGGSGAGRVQSSELTFGLGDHYSTVDVVVYWPSGRSSTHNSLSVPPDHRIVIQEPETAISIDETTAMVTIEFDAYTQTFDWVFAWETDISSSPGEDKVYLTQRRGTDCEVPAGQIMTLQDTGDEALKASVVRLYSESTQTFIYRHTLRWEGRTCLSGCRYTYELESSYGTNSDSYTPGQPTIDFTNCPQAY